MASSRVSLWPLAPADALSQALVLMAFAQLGFAIMSVAARLGASVLPWQEVAASRFLVGALVGAVMARSRGRALTISTPAARRAMVWRALWGTCSAVATFSTLASPRISLGDTVTIFATGPMFIALLSWPLLREKVSPRVATAIGVSFAGIVLVVRPSFHVAPVEGCTALAATVFSSLAMISLRKMGPGESSEVVVFYFSAFASLVLMALSIPVFQWPDARGWGFLALTGLMGGLAQVAMTKAYSLAHAAAVSVASYLGLVFTRAIAVAVFGEIPTVTQVAGSVLIIACGLVLALRGEAGPQRSGTGARAVRG